MGSKWIKMTRDERMILKGYTMIAMQEHEDARHVDVPYDTKSFHTVVHELLPTSQAFDSFE